jgi:hypothetical protein
VKESVGQIFPGREHGSKGPKAGMDLTYYLGRKMEALK